MAKRVMLIPGFQNRNYDGWAKWQKLVDRLKKEGYSVVISNYSMGDPMRDSLFSYAEELEKEMRLIKQPDVVIAHSMGCLVARCAVEQSIYKYPKKLKLILIEGPHGGLPNKGISLARITAKIFELTKRIPNWDVPSWDSWKDMQQDSIFIARLKKGSQKSEVTYYEIGGLFAHLFPEIFSLPPNFYCAGKRIFPAVTYLKLKSNPAVVDHILKIINEP